MDQLQIPQVKGFKTKQDSRSKTTNLYFLINASTVYHMTPTSLLFK